MADHLRAADAAERAQRGHEINRFEDIRLALRVVAEQQMEAGREIRVQPGVIAEVPQPQMSQMHADKIGARTACPRVFNDQNDKQKVRTFRRDVRLGRLGEPSLPKTRLVNSIALSGNTILMFTNLTRRA